MKIRGVSVWIKFEGWCEHRQVEILLLCLKGEVRIMKIFNIPIITLKLSFFTLKERE